ncbi:hypothetical protein CEP54_011361 [Fusarium duplospermum]|uniref:Uncharacterized protein n=1 Tax=Fusarium duplospermum TaxID=1325734 RepID=A0A428PEP8_9HYPO|nr:hypothetical protein CEP54_011361 [Fusarium duplospermum]
MAAGRGGSSASTADVSSARTRPCAPVAPLSPPGDPAAPAPVPFPAVRAAPMSSGKLDMGQAPVTGAAFTWGVSGWSVEVAASVCARAATPCCIVRVDER